MSKLIKSVSLGFTDSHSDKVYVVEMFENKTVSLGNLGASINSPFYDVICRYGKRSTPNSKVNLVTESKGFVAKKVFDRQVALKVKKGYKIEEQWELDGDSWELDRVSLEIDRVSKNTPAQPVPVPMRQNVGKRVVGW